MPALRIDKKAFSYIPSYKHKRSATLPAHPIDELEDLAQTLTSDIHYPEESVDRVVFRTEAGKRVTAHQWDVYDFTRTIPSGKVTTYKEVALAVGGSPRSVGNALRNNPFAPFIPCHRVVASSLFIGGFRGEWGKDDKTGTQCKDKLNLLAREGVSFGRDGYLLDRNCSLWKHP